MLPESAVLDLLLRSYSGDRAAYAELLSWLQTHCLRQLNSGLRNYYRFPRELKDDITQEVLIAFHQHHETFDTSRPFLPWVNTMIRHKTIDFLRRKEFRATMESVSIDSINQSWATSDNGDPEEAEPPLTILDHLPEKQAEIIRLSKIEGHSNKEIAAALNMTESNVKINVFRTLNALRKLFSDPRE